MSSDKTVLAIVAHPDDVEFTCAGTLALLKEKGWRYHFTSYLYYVDPVEGKDKFGRYITPSTVVDIARVIGIKEQMLKCHDSQRSWLAAHHGMDEYIIAMKESSAKRGRDIRVEYAEGFRQHLGHAFLQENILKAELGELATTIHQDNKERVDYAI